MESFKSKYPAFTALLGIIGAVAAKAAKAGESVVQKFEDELTLAPAILAFYPSMGALPAEFAAIKAAPVDMEAGIEVLVTDFALSSDKAKAIMPKAFLLAEKLAECALPAEELYAVLKG